MRPAWVTVLGQSFTILEVPHGQRLTQHSDDGSWWARGTVAVDEQVIAVRPSQPFDGERSTVLHEIFHAAIRLAALEDRFVGFDPDKNPNSPAEEQFVYAFANIVLSVLRDNPELVAYLTERRPGS